MQCRKYKYPIILLIYIFILTNSIGLYSNDLPVLVDEVIDIQIKELPAQTNSSGIQDYEASVTGTYLFTQEKPGKTMMHYPVPVNSRNISVRVNGIKCPVKHLKHTWKTGLGGYPIFAFTTDPDSLPFELEVCYTHDIPQNENLVWTFLYPLIFNREEGDTTETSIAFHISMPKQISLFEIYLGNEEIEYTIIDDNETNKISCNFVNNNPKFTMDFIVSFSSELTPGDIWLKHSVKQEKTAGMNVVPDSGDLTTKYTDNFLNCQYFQL